MIFMYFILGLLPLSDLFCEVLGYVLYSLWRLQNLEGVMSFDIDVVVSVAAQLTWLCLGIIQ